MAGGRAGWLAATALVLAACSSSGSTDAPFGAPATTDAPVAGSPLDVPNEGGSMEGHTPRGFAGSGTGLFAGDNLNPGFPDGDGVQLWLTFDLPAGAAVPARARLTSDALHVAGDPFGDLGVLRAEPVSYERFGRDLFDLPAAGAPADCELVGDSRIECDLTASVVAAVENGADRAQYRLRFDRVADGDGRQDLALFFLTDSNTNEPGIFTLELR